MRAIILSTQTSGINSVIMIFALLTFLCVVAWILAISSRRRLDAHNSELPVCENDGIIMDMQKLPSDTIRKWSKMWLLVELDDGSRHRFIVSAENTFAKGDVGHLRWQGDRILSFKIISHYSGY